ncbi:MAG: hypothetical protein M1826_006391 [Phylliscum demangeonii]|nr:MAG: hypothetical protein M1826_006391 [Phylliscum demangeonii]
MCRRLKLALVMASWCLTVFTTAAPIEKGGRPVPNPHPLDEYGYGQTLEFDRLEAKDWIEQMHSAKGIDNLIKRIQVVREDGGRTQARSDYDAQSARHQEEYTQRLKQNEEHFQQRVAADRIRHPIAAGAFKPENDADYQADIQQIERDFEQRMAEVNEWEKQAHPAHRDGRATRLRRRAQQIRDQGMKKAYERHDMRKGRWNGLADFDKRELAISRHMKSMGLSRESSRGNNQLDHLIEVHERDYARHRPMPSEAKQIAGFPSSAASSSSSTSSSSSSSSSTHQLALLSALENHVLHTARSSWHQLEHNTKVLGPAVVRWEKHSSESPAPAVRKVGPLRELKAVSSW